MSLKYADRTKESAAAPGNGNLTLGGAVAGGFFTFASFMTNGDTTYYVITDNQGAVEVGLGTWTTGGVFVRNTVYASSNGGAKVNFANPVQIYCDAPASRLALLDAAGKMPAVDGSALTNLTAANLVGAVPANRGGAGAVTGLLKADGSGNVTAAVSNTDYAPPNVVSSSAPSGSGLPGQLWVRI